MQKIMVMALSAAAFTLAGCESKLNGTYAMDSMMGKMSYTFNSNGKVVQSQLGMKMEMPYELDGKKVKLIGPGGAAMI